MPRFFFHQLGPGNVMRDDIGCEFDNFELAYVEAFRSMVDIGAEMIKGHEDPGGHRIEIVGADGVILDNLSFDEIFRRRRTRVAVSARSDPLGAQIERNRRLRAEMREAFGKAKELVASTRETLRRKPV